MSATRDVIAIMPQPIPPFDELPELMVSLRSIGSRRSWPNEQPVLREEQERLFAPLLEARRAAAKAATRPQVVAAFDARRLTALVDATVRGFASDRFGARASARRAFEAELFEIVEPLRDAMQSLRSLAERPLGADGSPEQFEQWSLWLAQLQVVFRAADSCWPALSAALASTPRQEVGRGRPLGGEERR
jgi:hypothetical protein